MEAVIKPDLLKNIVFKKILKMNFSGKRFIDKFTFAVIIGDELVINTFSLDSTGECYIGENGNFVALLDENQQVSSSRKKLSEIESLMLKTDVVEIDKGVTFDQLDNKKSGKKKNKNKKKNSRIV
jgi:hypothetical protein